MNKTMKKGKYLWAAILGLVFSSTQGFEMNKPVCEKNDARSLIEIKKAPEHIQSRKLLN
jgi:hypothetical protein